MVDHAVHIASADCEEETRSSEALPIVAGLPVGLADDADAVSGGFEDTTQDRHGKARVIDVGVAGHKHDIEFVPAASLGLGHGHGQGGFGQGTVGLAFPQVIEISGDDIAAGADADGCTITAGRGIVWDDDGQRIRHGVPKRGELGGYGATSPPPL